MVDVKLTGKAAELFNMAADLEMMTHNNLALNLLDLLCRVRKDKKGLFEKGLGSFINTMKKEDKNSESAK